jgi:hypothetical protein
MTSAKRSAAGDGHVRLGRPPLPPEAARQQRVVTFVTAGEKVLLDKLARSESSSLSAVCHQLIAAGLKKSGGI